MKKEIVVLGDFSQSVYEAITLIECENINVLWYSYNSINIENIPIKSSRIRFNNLSLDNFINDFTTCNIDDYIFIKGNITTSNYLKHLIPIIKVYNKNVFLSHIAEISTEKNTFILTDGALNIKPKSYELLEITHNAIEYCNKHLNIKPVVTLITADPTNNKIDATSTGEWICYNLRNNDNIISSNVQAIDTALCEKNYMNKFNSTYIKPNILVFPDIISANCVWKTLELANVNTTIIGVLGGTSLKIGLNSRNDSITSKYRTIMRLLG